MVLRQAMMDDERAPAAPESAEDLSLKFVADLVGTDLEWSTITVDTRNSRQKQKCCLFCGVSYAGGPLHIRAHLDGNIKPRHVSSFACLIRIDHVLRSTALVSREQHG